MKFRLVFIIINLIRDISQYNITNSGNLKSKHSCILMMDIQKIKERVNIALTSLFERDNWLIKHDISEQSISHKLAEYLQPIFADFNVDCEYNGNIDKPNGRKKIFLVKQNLKDKGLLNESEENDLEKELAERAVFPDIIIHKRGTNDFNLCVIEVKKSTSSVSFNYDYLKLAAYTTDLIGNDLSYNLGIFICFIIDENNPLHEIKYYKNGEQFNF